MCEYELEKRIYATDATIRHQTIQLLGAALSSLSSPTGTSLRTGLHSPSLCGRALGIQKSRARRVPGSSAPAVPVVTLRSALRTAKASPRAGFVLKGFGNEFWAFEVHIHGTPQCSA